MQTINERIELILNNSGKTKTAFGESLKVSQQYISKLIKTGNPSDLLIEDICQKYNINESWLRTGNGEMYLPMSENDIIAEFSGALMKDEKESFRRRLIGALARLDDKGWKTLESIANDVFTKDCGRF